MVFGLPGPTLINNVILLILNTKLLLKSRSIIFLTPEFFLLGIYFSWPCDVKLLFRDLHPTLQT